MPLYNYACTTHGEFDAWRPMAKSSAPARCPICRRLARRGVSAPNLADMDSNNRKAHSINERSAHEPRVVSKGDPGWSAIRGHAHGGGHDGHGHGHARAKPSGHRHGPARPWMVGH
jgi:putative FmdB family regulatory protein